MTPIEIVIKRTGMSEDDAAYYVELSKMRIRSYLNLDGDADVDQYVFEISSIASLLWQIDTGTKNSASSIGYSSRSFSEGGVSESVSVAYGQSILQQDYEIAITDILNGIDGRYFGRLAVY